jgi:hypothetical protein
LIDDYRWEKLLHLDIEQDDSTNLHIIVVDPLTPCLHAAALHPPRSLLGMQRHAESYSPRQQQQTKITIERASSSSSPSFLSSPLTP